MTALPLPRGHRIDRVAVVMPANNEEDHLELALEAVQRSADALRRVRSDVETRVTVVLDSCTDGSAAVMAGFAASDPRFSALEVSYRSAGASRAAGVRASGIGATRRRPPGQRWTPPPWAGRTWLANTDADSRVPENWLVRQLEFAEAGADAVLGSVEPDPAGMDPELLRCWHEHHPFRRGPPAYLRREFRGPGFRLPCRRRVRPGHVRRRPDPGARPPQPRLHGHRNGQHRVMTSGRTHARAPHGFATYLRSLGHLLPPAS